MSKQVAEIIVNTLEAAGVKHCYGIVGDTLNVIAGHIAKSSIRWMHMRHEEAGAFAAQGEAGLTGELTAVAGTCGPGSLHFINGLYEASRNRVPVLLIATQVVTSEIGFNFIQEVDFKAVYDDLSVFCDVITSPEQALRKTVLACQTAIAKRGVAVLIVPVDIAMAHPKDQTPFKVHFPKPVIRPSDDELDRMAEILNAGEKIAIYGGAGCQAGRDQVLAIADLLQAPIAHTSRGKDFLEWDNPHNIGMTGMLGNEAGYQAVLECDTLLLLGCDFAWRQFYPGRARIVQVDLEATHLGMRHPVELGVVGDIKATLEALKPRLSPRGPSEFHDAAIRHHTKAIDAWEAHIAPRRHDSIPGKYLGQLIGKHADDDALFSADDGTPAVWMLRHIPANGKRRTFGSLLHGSMGGGLATGLGLQAAAPGRQVVCLCGDGGLAMGFADIFTTIQEDLPVKIAVFDNGKLGFVEIEQKTEGMLNTYTDLINPDFGAVAKAAGLWGATVDKAEDLEAAIIAWLAHPGPALLNVKVNPQELVMPPFVAAEPAVGMALYMTKAVLHGRGRDLVDLAEQNLP
ncbi:thiamine pyrophosphate-dependent enzyme [Phenylobacterium sp.]|uniref:thiamine pyrophosphate-dependent enzyme n=1 Tax=Phenylobacterium sp. TaxID=1871053 RepID=UPI00120A0F74|nr:thiamine pyrophosphate-dependent enzyme [Phenylobacterium sp.]THD63849.1 MAG: ubiquinone-dependent pyruvate dehydrogenase [Phenylobacterium sp.]